MKNQMPVYLCRRAYLLLVLLAFVGCQTKSDEVQLLSRFNHVYLSVADMDRCIAFYTAAFDLEVAKHVKKLKRTTEDGMSTESDINLAFFRFPGQGFVLEVGENPEFKPENSSANYLHVCVEVKDIETAGKRVEEAGGILSRPLSLVEIEGVTAKTMFFTGPDGETIELLQLISGGI
ncbi:VOC family protein [Algoriphagus lutimaris]|uniref:VOC family protein n=1 Tax=Algoriphagus lutimaris TaxID=613197 RepID=UPI00196A42FD|nr:VOC family protein [Algoriphagus lutimaris]MBN3520987.1 VOC family protein [Algoriphagus lutimaris]